MLSGGRSRRGDFPPLARLIDDILRQLNRYLSCPCPYIKAPENVIEPFKALESIIEPLRAIENVIEPFKAFIAVLAILGGLGLVK